MNDFDSFTCHSKKIIAAAINYKSTANCKNVPIPEEPIFFLKPTSSYIIEGQQIILPHNSKDIVHEVELGVIMGRHCRCISKEAAPYYIAGYCLALDLTDVKKMEEVRSKGQPWTFGKGFDTACPVSRFIHYTKVRDPQNTEIWCRVNGRIRQQSTTNEMIFTINELISYISQYIRLEPYDLILTGTPSGAEPLKPNDVVECGLGDIIQMRFPVKEQCYV